MKNCFLLWAGLACAPSSSGSTVQSKERPPVAKTEGQAEPPSPAQAVIEKVCASPCRGTLARLTVFRTAEGKVGAIRYQGDLHTCSHPPRVYFDADGQEIVTIPEKPVVPGSEEAKRFVAQQEAAVAGMKEAETLRCPD